jgi:hypothetical protein
MKPEPTSTATHSETSTARPMATGAVPAAARTVLPTMMPSATPMISWMAPSPRSTLLADRAHGRGHGGEERLGVADHVPGEVPGDPGRHRRLCDGAQPIAQGPQPTSSGRR